MGHIVSISNSNNYKFILTVSCHALSVPFKRAVYDEVGVHL